MYERLKIEKIGDRNEESTVLYRLSFLRYRQRPFFARPDNDQGIVQRNIAFNHEHLSGSLLRIVGFVLGVSRSETAMAKIIQEIPRGGSRQNERKRS